MEFYLIFSSISPRFPSGKWLLLGWTVTFGFRELQLLHHRPMASAPLTAAKLGRPQVCCAIRKINVLLREGWDEFTNAYPLSASIPFTNLKSAPKTLGTSALTASDSLCQSSHPSPPPPSHDTTINNILVGYLLEIYDFRWFANFIDF